ncbi:bile acid germinant receptor pseudoprotease CspC [Terrisporobacter glycolicus]|uniref:bile acid germinant receptor pseudoprotease CspC n=1 Tax=Terrisporobacter glycolicus TaxID=36841 RepID=UPI0024183C4A|nr:bile acid germinant receptor pseudoprotease CspC [Terrisporobacter glycolicus]
MILYKLPIEEVKNSLQDNGIYNFIPLNNQSGVIYTPEDYDAKKLDNIDVIDWWEESVPMSTLIDITDNLKEGIDILTASGISTFNIPYVNLTGEGILVAIIDSGIDYLHPDFIKEDGTSKIVSIWNQESDKSKPPSVMTFGSEYSNEEINQAIKNSNGDLCTDEIGTGTIAAGIVASGGKIKESYKGIAPNAELIVVKLREYKDTYSKERINYESSDFFAAISYVISVSKKLNKPLIINFSIGATSTSLYNLSILNTFTELSQSGIVIVSGAGNEGNTDIHYSGKFSKGTSFNKNDYQDVILQEGDGTNIDITINFLGPDKIKVAIISPSGEISQLSEYVPDNYKINGSFNLENTDYSIEYILPWLLSGGTVIKIKLRDIKPGIWTIRIIPEYIINGNYNLYIPNRNIISPTTRFLDGDSSYTITRFGLLKYAITVGVYNEKTNSMWLGSSKGPHGERQIKPDIVASGVDVISTFLNNTYNTGTGSGISSSIVCGILALIMEYILKQTHLPRYSLYNEPLKTYLMIGATQNSLYIYPNISQGYGLLNYQNTLIKIAKNID